MDREVVVLLHGAFRTRLDMWPMQKYLEWSGYEVLNISYPARRRPLKGLASWLDHKLSRKLKDRDVVKLHFVTHSLGGLLARYYIAHYRPQNIGRVVMMGTPNSGSEWADFLTRHKWLSRPFRFLFGPVSVELMTTHIHENMTVDYDVGIIAGRKSIMPFAKKIFEGEHDGLVAVEKTKLNGMKDHIVLETSHTYMIMDLAVFRQVKNFLSDGKFSDPIKTNA